MIKSVEMIAGFILVKCVARTGGCSLDQAGVTLVVYEEARR
jgi:hypothetical protein